MHLARFIHVPFLALLALIPCMAKARQAAPAADPAASIRLNVVVSHKNGPPVGGLEQNDFTVIDNKHTQPITSFRAVSGRDSKARVIVVLDAVNIDYERVAFAREEVEKYLRAEGGQLTHPTSFALLTDNGMKLQEQYSTDGNSIAAAVEANVTGLRTIRRTSQYGGFDRYNISIEGLRELAQREVTTPERKIVLFVSPGWPILSSPGVENSLDAKQQKQLMATWLDLKVWPDVAVALTMLKGAGIKMAFLSNFTADMLDAAMRNSDLEGIFGPHLSTDLVKAFKPVKSDG